MPLNSSLHEKQGDILPCALYIVATPIGNKDDITLRALAVLKKADWVAAEDTRHTARLFSLHQIQNRMISYHEHNEAERTPMLIEKLKKGESIALVSNAGTPTISDPGYDLIKAAIENHIPVVPIPGVCAPGAALSVSGLPTDAFVFMGFLSKKHQKRQAQMEAIKKEKRTVVLYESPKRIKLLLRELIEADCDRKGMLAREMTKMHEEFIRGELSQILAVLEQKAEVKGECTLLIAGGDEEPVSMEAIRLEMSDLLSKTKVSPSDLVKILAGRYNVPRKILYEEILKLER